MCNHPQSPPLPLPVPSPLPRSGQVLLMVCRLPPIPTLHTHSQVLPAPFTQAVALASPTPNTAPTGWLMFSEQGQPVSSTLRLSVWTFYIHNKIQIPCIFKPW